MVSQSCTTGTQNSACQSVSQSFCLTQQKISNTMASQTLNEASTVVLNNLSPFNMPEFGISACCLVLLGGNCLSALITRLSSYTRTSLIRSFVLRTPLSTGHQRRYQYKKSMNKIVLIFSRFTLRI